MVSKICDWYLSNLMCESKVNTPLELSRTVYIADRDYTVSDSIRSLLDTAQIVSRIFVNGQSLLAQSLIEPPLCIVMDTILDDIDSVQFLKKLEEENACIPIILLGQNSKIPQVVSLLKGGAWDYLEKPFVQRRLLESVQKAIKFNRVKF